MFGKTDVQKVHLLGKYVKTRKIFTTFWVVFISVCIWQRETGPQLTPARPGSGYMSICNELWRFYRSKLIIP